MGEGFGSVAAHVQRFVLGAVTDDEDGGLPEDAFVRPDAVNV